MLGGIARFLRFPLMIMVVLFCTSGHAAEQSGVIDSRNPPPGFSPPMADAARDLSMAKYARDSFLEGEEGVVHLRVLVRRDGSVGDSQVERSSGSLRLDKYAQDIVKDWPYQPGRLNGDPVDTWIPVDIVWALQTLRTDAPPDLIRILATYWPSEAVQLHQQGNTTVRYLVSHDGVVSKAVVDQSSGYPLLDRAAMRAVSRFHFNPAVFDFGPGTWFRVTLAWRTGREEFRELCFGPDEAIANRILECTDHLTNSGLTAFEKARTYEARGTAYRAERENELAIADYTAGIAASPGYANLYIARGNAYLATGKRNLAMPDFDTAIQVEPLSAQAYIARGSAFLQSGDRQQGTADINKAVQLPTADHATVYNDACYELAKGGSPRDALNYCDKSLELRPGNVHTLDSRGYTYFRLGEFERAIKDYSAVLQINKSSARALFARGIAKRKTGDASGEQDLNKAQEIDPTIDRQMAAIGIVP